MHQTDKDSIRKLLKDLDSENISLTKHKAKSHWYGIVCENKNVFGFSSLEPEVSKECETQTLETMSNANLKRDKITDSISS